MLSNTWKYIPGEEYCSKVTDGTHDTPKQSEYGRPLITSKHIKGDEIDFNTAYLISEQDFHEINKRSKVEQWDVIISMIGAYCGFCFIESNEKINYAVKNVGLFKAGSEINAKWLYYYLNSPIGKAHLDAVKSGSTQPYIALGSLRNLPILVPTQDEVKEKIVRVLDAIDKKIRVNNRISAELEAMAKTLYDYWFVQFDFPNANGKPYKTSGGKMVYSPTLKREIPEGWEAGNILNVAHLLGGGTPTKTKPEYWNGTIPFFTPSDSDNNIYSVSTEDYITDEGLQNSSTRLFEPHTVFITARGSVGRLALNAVPMAMNQSCYALKAKNGISYTFLFFLTKELIHHLEVKSSGSVFNSIVSSDIEYTNLALPSERTVIEEFSALAEPIFEKIEASTKENRQLSVLRDWLLPMLMNGQVTVK
ncbi:restriction endonuclease subunit S [Aeromonas caviae]|uniref:restriction endonuclease subunit S n=1 Tax=Aeromonas caviae TaxID=648 RepID=UPI00214EC4FB|nr:restriction endonuclease subunit S [Aeromonas caviae]MCR3894824.1 restriction endonuclease subunit S [Aeromonas caviae]